MAADTGKKDEEGLDDFWEDLPGAGKKGASATDSDVAAMFPLQVGKNVFIRTITHYHVGRIAHLSKLGILLENASWIADSGRWHDVLKGGFPEKAEIEPFPDPVFVSLGAVVDVTVWKHPLPNKQQ